MVELILPGVQLGAWAWRNVIAALRTHDDAHLIACAQAIETQLDRLEKHFADDPEMQDGTVVFETRFTYRPTHEG